MDKNQYYSHGKLMLMGEYFVLYGAKSLAIPLNVGQYLTVENDNTPNILSWNAFDKDAKTPWFQAQFDFSKKFEIRKTNNDEVAINLRAILKCARKMNKSIWKTTQGKKVNTQLTFQRDWGFGSSSSNISNIGHWLGVDAMQLHFKTSNGSGYDVAAAQISLPIRYYLITKNQPVVEALNYKPVHKENILFVYSGKKQDTTKQISNLKLNKRIIKSIIPVIDELTETFIRSTDIEEIISVVKEHEMIVGKALLTKPIKQLYFNDFIGCVKSLGAWGGDFFMAISSGGQEYTRDYFKRLGYDTIFTYEQLALYC